MTRNSDPIRTYLEAGKALKQRFKRGEKLIGTFVKSFDPSTTEILAQCGPDFLIVDQQHRQIPPGALEAIVLAARAYKTPVLVRIHDHEPATINTALDQGALGVVAPAVNGGQDAESIAKAALYGSGERGFSPSTAANGYGALPLGEYKEAADEANIVLVQIETASGLAAADEIAQTSNVDGVFIGPVDLAHALEKAPSAAKDLDSAINAIAAACDDAQTPVGIFITAPAQIAEHHNTPMNFFVLGTDHSLLRQQAETALASARREISSPNDTFKGQ